MGGGATMKKVLKFKQGRFLAIFLMAILILTSFATPVMAQPINSQAIVVAAANEPTATQTQPVAEVWNDDVLNVVYGMKDGMEYKLDSQNWVMYKLKIFNRLDFSGDHTLQVRYAAMRKILAGPITTLYFTTNPVPVKPAAPKVTADDVNNTVLGIDATMEYKLDTATTYTKYTGTLPDLSGDHKLYVRVAAEGINPASDDTVLTFTTNPVPVKPAAPNVTADDVNNTVLGIDATMEYKLDTATTYTKYTGTLPDLSGNHTLYVRVAAEGINPASDDTVLTFTTNPAPQAKGKVLFTFDDAWLNQYENAFPVLEAAGFMGTVYANRDIVMGTHPEIMRLNHLQTLYQAGWDVGNHTTNHADIGDKTDPASLELLKTLYLDNQNWIISRIGERGAFHIAYPSGLYSSQLIEIIKRQGAITGRAANNDAEDGFTPTPVSNPNDFYTLPVVSLESSDDALQYARDSIDKVVRDGSTVIFMIHRVTLKEDGFIDLTQADLQTIVDYAKLQVDAERLSVMTFSKWYASATTPETPLPPAVTANDELNKVDGMAEGMEYNLDGAGYMAYNATTFSSLNFDGEHYLLVRQAATSTTPAGQPKILVFKPTPGSGKVLFTFDDGWKSQFTYAAGILETAGFKGTAYVNKNSVDWDPDNNFMDVSELEALYNQGWDIANHTTNHADLINPDYQGNVFDTPEMWDVNYLGQQIWLETAIEGTKSAWTRGARHVNYPNGMYSDGLITYLKGIGVLTGRTSTWGQQATIGMTPDDYYKLKVIPLDNSDLWYVNNAKAAISNAVLDGTTVIFMIHKVEPVITSTTLYPGITMLTETLTEIVNYTKTFSDNDELTVMTISEWYEAMK
jgi:peptidoglycan/xylan/chitin deacetylase (PgdA/CDA1 family)